MPADIRSYRELILQDGSRDKHLQAEEWDFCKKNFEHWCRTWYWLVNKKTERCLFELNPIQRWYLSESTNNDLILKARKVGISTLKLAQGLHRFCFQSDQRGILVSHNNPTCVELFGYVKLAYDLLPDFLKPPLIVRQGQLLSGGEFPVGSPRAGEICGSKFQIMSAEGPRPGAGFTFTFVHLSEYAWFKHPTELKASVLQARGIDAPGAMESTANGYNEFYEEYIYAKENTTSRFKAHFFPWTDDPTCVAPVRNKKQWSYHVLEVKESAALSDEQAQFYQDCLEELSNDTAILKQEWPLNDIEAFKSTGRCYFDADLLQRLMDVANRTPMKHTEEA